MYMYIYVYVYIYIYIYTCEFRSCHTHTHAMPQSNTILVDDLDLYRHTHTHTHTHTMPQARKVLVNDLDLYIDTPQGTRSLGNSLASADRSNNVEQITYESPTAGTYAVHISGFSIKSGMSQAYALVVTGDATEVSCTAATPPPTPAPTTPSPTPSPSPAPTAESSPTT